MIEQVYLAGPIFRQSDAEAKDWREWFKTQPSEFTWSDPMARDYRGREDECVNEIVEGDKADILASDAVIALVETPSAGTSMEIYFAWQQQIPVIAITPGRVSPWIRYHSSVVVASLAEAMAALQCGF